MKVLTVLLAACLLATCVYTQDKFLYDINAPTADNGTNGTNGTEVLNDNRNLVIYLADSQKDVTLLDLRSKAIGSVLQSKVSNPKSITIDYLNNHIAVMSGETIRIFRFNRRSSDSLNLDVGDSVANFTIGLGNDFYPAQTHFVDTGYFVAQDDGIKVYVKNKTAGEVILKSSDPVEALLYEKNYINGSVSDLYYLSKQAVGSRLSTLEAWYDFGGNENNNTGKWVVGKEKVLAQLEGEPTSIAKVNGANGTIYITTSKGVYEYKSGNSANRLNIEITNPECVKEFNNKLYISSKTNNTMIEYDISSKAVKKLPFEFKTPGRFFIDSANWVKAGLIAVVSTIFLALF